MLTAQPAPVLEIALSTFTLQPAASVREEHSRTHALLALLHVSRER